MKNFLFLFAALVFTTNCSAPDAETRSGKGLEGKATIGEQARLKVVTEALGRLGVPATALFSTLGRTAARGLETRLCVHWLMAEYDRLMQNLKLGDLSTADTSLWEPDT